MDHPSQHHHSTFSAKSKKKKEATKVKYSQTADNKLLLLKRLSTSRADETVESVLRCHMSPKRTFHYQYPKLSNVCSIVYVKRIRDFLRNTIRTLRHRVAEL